MHAQAQHRLDEAARVYRRVLTQAPDHADASNNLGCVLQAQGKLAEASACFAQALTLVKAQGAAEVGFVCIVAAPEGVATVEKAHPDVTIHAGALDRQLNERKYIMPGLGDFGDRLYGT